MTEFGSKLKRRIWQPFLLLMGVAVVAAVSFSLVLPLTQLSF